MALKSLHIYHSVIYNLSLTLWKIQQCIYQIEYLPSIHFHEEPIYFTGQLLLFLPLLYIRVGYFIFTCVVLFFRWTIFFFTCFTLYRYVILFLPVVHLTGGLSYFYLQYTWGRWVGGSRCRPDTRTPPGVGTRTWTPWDRKLNTALWWVYSGTWLFRWRDWPASGIYRQLRKSRREKKPYISTELYYISWLYINFNFSTFYY